jgi:hypothetical protein
MDMSGLISSRESGRINQVQQVGDDIIHQGVVMDMTGELALSLAVIDGPRMATGDEAAQRLAG